MFDVFIPKNSTAITRKKKSKYRNTKVKAFGKTFDSILERDRYYFLMGELKRGAIRNLKHHAKFQLDCTTYTADFTYEIAPPDRIGWHQVIEDTKGGYRLPADFKIKMKMMAARGTPIRIVKSPTEPI